MDEGPTAFRPPIGKRDEPMAEQVRGRLGLLTVLQIVGTRYQLVTEGQNPARHQRGIFKRAKAEYDIDAVAYMVDITLGNQDLHTHIWVARLKRGDQRA